MRYIFSQLLELQNELNAKIDYDKVDFIVDGLLKLLEKGVELYPTIKKFSFPCVDSSEKYPDVSFRTLTQSELDSIVAEFKSLGFHNVIVEKDETSYLFPVKFVFSWE